VRAGRPRAGAVRVMLADDAVVIREGLARLLTDAGIDVAAQVGDAAALQAAVDADPPDVVIADIRMPPGFSDEGLRAAAAIRARHPKVAVVVLSQYVDVAYAVKLVKEGGRGVGYLLKDRIVDVPALVDSMRRVTAGECVVEPSLVEELLRERQLDDPLEKLTAREREILALMAQGRTDRGIREELYLSQKTVESHVRSIFRKLDLPSSPIDNRRVHAVLTFLRKARE
jgi:DNA-binding NarL/FixJ family response regulator